MSEPRNPWVTLSSRQVYANPWIVVREGQILNAKGKPGIYGVVSYRNRAVGVVPVDDEGHTYLVGQWRYCHGRYEWEIPEGGCPEGESSLQTAHRELREETGLLATRIEPLRLGLELSNSISTEVCDLYLARGLSQGPADPEDCEELRVWRLPLSEAVAMAKDGRIQDSPSVIALLLAESKGLCAP